MPDYSTTDGLAEALRNYGDLSVAEAQPFAIEPGTDYRYLVPAGYKVEHFNTDDRLDNPTRATGTSGVRDTASFITYLQRHASAATTVWVSATTPGATAILDDHGATGPDIPGAVVADAGKPGWGEHRVHLQWDFTEGWKRWALASSEWLTQDGFAELVEAGMGEIAEPKGADLLELAQSIHASTKATFKSDRRLATGVIQVAYVEDTTMSGGKDGDLMVPTTLTLVLSPFKGADPQLVRARLRTRVKDGKLTVSVILNDPPAILDKAIEHEIDKVREALPDLCILNGRPR